MTKKQYLMMCEQLGTEPKPEEYPIEFEDFPYRVQLAITIYYILPDIWEGFSGTYMGKDYSILPYLVDIYNIENNVQFMQILSMINKIIMDIRSQEQKQRQKLASKGK